VPDPDVRLATEEHQTGRHAVRSPHSEPKLSLCYSKDSCEMYASMYKVQNISYECIDFEK